MEFKYPIIANGNYCYVNLVCGLNCYRFDGSFESKWTWEFDQAPKQNKISVTIKNNFVSISYNTQLIVWNKSDGTKLGSQNLQSILASSNNELKRIEIAVNGPLIFYFT